MAVDDTLVDNTHTKQTPASRFSSSRMRPFHSFSDGLILHIHIGFTSCQHSFKSLALSSKFQMAQKIQDAVYVSVGIEVALQCMYTARKIVGNNNVSLTLKDMCTSKPA